MMARYLRTKGITAWELATQLGYRSTGYPIIEVYTSDSPDYLPQAARVIEVISVSFRVKELLDVFYGIRKTICCPVINGAA